VTETDEVARALDDAARLWPEERGDRSALLRRLIERGSQATRAEGEAEFAARRKAIRATAGVLSGLYSPGEAARLRDEWPE